MLHLDTPSARPCVGVVPAGTVCRIRQNVRIGLLLTLLSTWGLLALATPASAYTSAAAFNVYEDGGESGNTCTQTYARRVTSRNDDAEERSNGDMYRSSSDIELVNDGSRRQLIGLRFRDTGIPQGATITNAYIQFTVDEKNSGSTHLTIQAHDTNDAGYFRSRDGNISSRRRTGRS